MMNTEAYNTLSNQILGAAIHVHKELGPGLLESAYEACLEYELMERGFAVQRQVPMPVVYRSLKLECGYRLDLVVNQMIILEIKATEKLNTVHEAQLLTYLRLSGMKLGYLLNFNMAKMMDGVKRLVCGSLDQ